MFFMGRVGSRPLGDQELKAVGQEYSLFVRGIIASDSVSRNHTIRARCSTFRDRKWRDNASLGAHRAPLQIDQLAEFLQIES
jgi:hypothetical protein